MSLEEKLLERSLEASTSRRYHLRGIIAAAMHLQVSSGNFVRNCIVVTIGSLLRSRRDFCGDLESLERSF
jgi:hypothetical protein